MTALKGNVSDLRSLAKRVDKFPLSLVHEVAQQASPAITQLALQSHVTKRSVYGEAYGASKVDGKPLTLERTGLTGRTIRFVTVGTIVRCVLGAKYQRYLIGKYKILPMGRMPASWAERIRSIVANTQVKL